MQGRRLACPGCAYPMLAVQVRGVDVDRCRACGALWLDAGELAKARPTGKITITLGRGSRHACPVCDARMRRANLGHVGVDWCKTCGIYLDAGVLERIGRGPAPVSTRRRWRIPEEDDLPLTIVVLDLLSRR